MVQVGLGPDWTCLFANDRDPKKAASYARNWGGQHFAARDVACLKSADLPELLDLVWGSPPPRATGSNRNRGGDLLRNRPAAAALLGR